MKCIVNIEIRRYCLKNCKNKKTKSTISIELQLFGTGTNYLGPRGQTKKLNQLFLSNCLKNSKNKNLNQLFLSNFNFLVPEQIILLPRGQTKLGSFIVWSFIDII